MAAVGYCFENVWFPVLVIMCLNGFFLVFELFFYTVCFWIDIEHEISPFIHRLQKVLRLRPHNIRHLTLQIPIQLPIKIDYPFKNLFLLPREAQFFLLIGAGESSLYFFLSYYWEEVVPAFAVPAFAGFDPAGLSYYFEVFIMNLHLLLLTAHEVAFFAADDTGEDVGLFPVGLGGGVFVGAVVLAESRAAFEVSDTSLNFTSNINSMPIRYPLIIIPFRIERTLLPLHPTHSVD